MKPRRVSELPLTAMALRAGNAPTLSSIEVVRANEHVKSVSPSFAERQPNNASSMAPWYRLKTRRRESIGIMFGKARWLGKRISHCPRIENERRFGSSDGSNEKIGWLRKSSKDSQFS